MELTIDDRARLMPLLRSAIADARAGLDGVARIVHESDGSDCPGLTECKKLYDRHMPIIFRPDRPEDLADSLEWGEDFLRRLETLDEA